MNWIQGMREIEEPGMIPQFLARAIRRMKLSFIEMVKIMGKAFGSKGKGECSFGHVKIEIY